MRVRWINRLDEVFGGGLSTPIVWRLSVDQAERFTAGVPADVEDLADAALAKRDGGAPRLLRRRLLKRLTAGAMGVSPHVVRLERQPGGSLRIVAPEPAFASAAGSGRQIIVAISRAPIGVDLERPEPPFPLPYDMLARGERLALLRRPAAEQDPAFLQLWTLKEAYAKAVERGLMLTPDRIRMRKHRHGWRIGVPGSRCGFAEVRADDVGISAAVSLE